MEANILNVRDLPQAQEVVPGDFIILEDKTGTKIIDFRDFVIGPRNTSFYNALVTNINTVSTFGIRLSGALQDSGATLLRGVRSEFNSLTARFGRINPLWYIARDIIGIPAGSKTGSKLLFVPQSVLNVEPTDINVAQTPNINANPYVNPVIFNISRESSVFDETGTQFLGWIWSLSLTATNVANIDLTYAVRINIPYYLA